MCVLCECVCAHAWCVGEWGQEGFHKLSPSAQLVTAREYIKYIKIRSKRTSKIMDSEAMWEIELKCQ